MDLEKRVQALEQEVELLKSQIQTTLLDIQEQMLTNAYPSLRAGGAPQQNNPPAGNRAAPPPIKSFEPAGEIEEDIDPEYDAEPIKVRKIKIDDVPFADEETSMPYEPTPAPAQSNGHRADSTDWSTLAELEEWVGHKIEKIGSERTRELIYMYHEQGRFTDDMVHALLGLVDVYSEETPPPFLAERAARPRKTSQDVRTQTAPDRQGVGVQGRPPHKSDPSKPHAPAVPGHHVHSQGFTAEQEKEMPLRPQPPAVPPNARGTQNGVDNPEADDSQKKRNLVLRLIAGVYNASAGVKWGEDDG